MSTSERAWEHLQALKAGVEVPTQLAHRAAVGGKLADVVRARRLARQMGYVELGPRGKLYTTKEAMCPWAGAADFEASEEPELNRYLWQVLKIGRRKYRSPTYQSERNARAHMTKAANAGYRLILILQRIELRPGAQWEDVEKIVADFKPEVRERAAERALAKRAAQSRRSAPRRSPTRTPSP